MRKSFVGYISNKETPKWTDDFGDSCCTPKQALVDLPKIWRVLDDIYIFSSEAKKVRVTIEEI